MAIQAASLEERLKAKPESLAFSRLAEYYRVSGDLAKAIDLCNRGNKRHPGYSTGRIILGRCYVDLGNYESAAEAFSSACDLDRHHMVAMRMLADTFMRLGEREKAGDLYSRLAAIDPWNEQLSQMADRMRVPGAAAQSEITGPFPMEKIPQPTVATAQTATVPEEPPAEVEFAPKIEVVQESAPLEPAIMELTRVVKPEPVLEPAAIDTTDESLSEVVTVTGNDITDRMAMLFGESDSVGKRIMEVPLPQDQEISETLTDDAVETIEVQPIDAIPDGNTISSRIDELFGRETLKMPAIREVVRKPDAARADEAGKTPASSPSDESEFEETMIMDAAEVKDFLRDDAVSGDASQNPAALDELIVDERGDAAPKDTKTAELVVDELDATGREPVGRKDGTASAEFAAMEETVTGDDIVRQMSGLFDEEDDKAIAEVEGAETVDDFFHDAPPAAEPVTFPPERPLTEDSSLSATIADPGRAPAEESELEATAVEEDMVSGDDVAGRIAGMFSGSGGGQIAGSSDGLDGKTGEEGTRVVDAGPPPEAGAIEDTVTENADIISGGDIEERLDEYFQGDAGKKRTPVSDEETVSEGGGSPEIDVDKRAESDETVIAGDIGAIDLASRTIDGKDVSPGHGVDEEVLIETALPDGDVLDNVESAYAVSEAENEKEATAVFTEFTPVPDAPPPPPEVPLFTSQPRQTLDEETIIAESPDEAAGAEPLEPDIPDHVLTPTLADIYLEQGQPRLALTIYRRLKEKKPDSEKLDARIKEIEKALAEGMVAPRPAPQAEKPAAPRSRKKGAGQPLDRKKKSGEDQRPLAGVRLKKRPGTSWRKK